MRRALTAMMLAALACGRDTPGADATVEALFEAPATVACVRIVAAGAMRTEVRDLTVSQHGSALSVHLAGLPTGPVLFVGLAYDGPCGATPTWVADSAVQTLMLGQIASFQMVFRPNGQAALTAQFQDTQGVPADAACLIVEAAGAMRTVEHQVSLAPGGTTTSWVVQGLPAGPVLLSVSAYAESCGLAATRTWSAPGQTVTLMPGQSVPVTVALTHP